MTNRRFVPPRRDELNDEQRELYDLIAGGRRASGAQHFALADEDGRLRGPFAAMLLAPPTGAALQQVGVAIRYESSLPDLVRELAILMVAGHWRCDFERHAHEPIAASLGATVDDVAAVAALQIPSGDAVAVVALRLTRSLLVYGDIDDELYQEAMAQIGERGIFEMTALVGYYATLALQLRTFRIGAGAAVAPADPNDA